MLQPIKLRTGVVESGIPSYVHPTTQSNSLGNQPGRPPSHTGSIAPPTPSTFSSSYAALNRLSQSGSATASSSRKATIVPLDTATPLLRAPPSPRTWTFSATRTSNSTRARSRSAGLLSTTTMISKGGKVCSWTDRIASASSLQRASVYAQMTTEMSRDGVVAGIAGNRSLCRCQGETTGKLEILARADVEDRSPEPIGKDGLAAVDRGGEDV